MFVYVFEFPGVWLGGEAVVIAEDQVQAETLLRAHVHEKYPQIEDNFKRGNNQILNEDEVKLVRTMSVNNPQVYVVDDGDY